MPAQALTTVMLSALSSRRSRPSLLAFWLLACLLIAASAWHTSTRAQINLKLSKPGSAAVVQTPHARAELVAQAPDGLFLTCIPDGETLWRRGDL